MQFINSELMKSCSTCSIFPPPRFPFPLQEDATPIIPFIFSLSCKNWLCEMLLKCCELLFCDKWCDWSSRVSSDISVSPRGGKSQTMFRLELGSRRESSIYLIISQHAEGVVMISSGCNSLPNKHCLMTSFDSLFFLKKKLR